MNEEQEAPSVHMYPLPDGVHVFIIEKYDDTIVWRVSNKLTNREYERGTFLRSKKWQDLLDTALALAEKKYKRPGIPRNNPVRM